MQHKPGKHQTCGFSGSLFSLSAYVGRRVVYPIIQGFVPDPLGNSELKSKAG